MCYYAKWLFQNYSVSTNKCSVSRKKCHMNFQRNTIFLYLTFDLIKAIRSYFAPLFKFLYGKNLSKGSPKVRDML